MSNQNQPTTIRSLWQRLFPAEHLEFISDLSPEDCFDRLMGLEQPKRGTLNAFSITTRRRKTKVHLYAPSVMMTRYSRGAYNTAAFTSEIDVNDSGLTIISGELRAVPPIPQMIVTTIVLTGVVMIVRLPIWFLLIILLGLLPLYALDTRSDYRKLGALIDEALITK